MPRYLPALLLACLTSFATLPTAGPVDELEDLVAEVAKHREETDLEVLDKIAAIGGRPAAEALIGIYGSQGTLYIRIEVMRRLPQFDGQDGSGQIAMQHLMDVATTARELELRDAALEALGESTKLGKGFLELIVESAAEDSVRERALDLHIEDGIESDHVWYRKIYEGELELAKVDKKAKRKKKKAKKGEDEEPAAIIYKLPSLAYKTFVVLAPDMKDSELLEVIDSGRPTVQYIALEEFSGRNLKKASKLAGDLYKHPETPVRLRILSARILKDSSGKKAAKRFLDTAGKFATPEALRMALADLLSEINDPSSNKKLLTKVGKGKVYEKRFVLRAVIAIEDDKLDEKVLKLLKSEDDHGVLLAVVDCLVKRNVAEAGAPIEELLTEFKDPVEISGVMDSLGELYGDSSEWEAKLLNFVKSGEVEIRNAALTQLAAGGNAKHFKLLAEHLRHDDWSTRLASLKALEMVREKRSVEAMVEQMQAEVGRMKSEFADVLFRLTGQPFRLAHNNWLAWWKKEKGDFDVISQAKLEEARERMELRRLKEVTSSNFFGIRIISQRVIFIIDVSGSMEELMRLEFEGAKALTRMAVARRELTTAIHSLARGALFNIITFSSGVDTWLEGGVAAADSTTRDEAEAFVSRLLAGGGTNLYESLQLAFEDPDVDTIFVLSDGEPSVGEVIEVGAIREHVARWNEHREIQINTIGIGEQLRILEWLAEDSGGEHVKLR